MFVNFIFIFVLQVVVRCSEIDIFPRMPITVEKSENVVCSEESKQYLDNLNNFTLWAHEMRDASAPSAISVLRGSGFNLGNLEQCLTANAPFPTQYCLAVIVANIPKTKSPRDIYSLEFDPNENIINKLYVYEDETKAPRNVVRMGWCIPASCSPNDAQNSLNNYLQRYDHPLKKENVSFSATVPQILCQSSNKVPELDLVDISFCILAITLLLLVVLATILDYNGYQNTEKKLSSTTLLLAFSAIKNFRGLSKADESEKPLKIFYGMKTISLFMVIAGHRFALFAGSPMITYDSIEEHFRTTVYSALYHGDLFVDTFFFIGGLLVTYIVLGLIDKKMFKPGLIILNRYLRLTPSYAFVIFFQATMLYHTGTGALWEPIVGQERKDCRQNWWTGILYISNLVNSDHMCITQSWYLPCDFHYFLLALLLVYLLKKNKKIGFVGIALSCTLTMIVTFYLIYANERPAFLRFLLNFLAGPKLFIDFQLTYIKTYTRGLPYFVGICGGYIYYTVKGVDFSISKFRSTILLFSSYGLLCFLLFTGIIFYDPYHQYNVLESSFYGTTFRFLWAIGTFGFIYAISFGPHGIIYNFLSWIVFIPLSKLSYGAYLCHMGFQLRDIASTVNPRKFVMFDVFLQWIGDTVWAYMFSFLLYLMIEEPMKNIFKTILFKNRGNKSTSNLPAEVDIKLENNKL